MRKITSISLGYIIFAFTIKNKQISESIFLDITLSEISLSLYKVGIGITFCRTLLDNSLFHWFTNASRASSFVHFLVFVQASL